MNKRIHALYQGSVQGVGFRFIAERTASSLGLTGWVRNLENGGVETVCEGREIDIKAFLRKIHGTFKEYIRDVEVEWHDANNEFETFDIRS